ncbi:thioredoxin family protein [Peribacillus psychrosaccharolyticus]|uniref:Thioredoxin family protein n=2 Tax=Peribacillus psychrosaccharolyticus TaxID=1407 RepID=A0A974NNM8_PERPY|nr:thioredoxin family protein [Peribacillus psychrosaccharolyticus]MEC2054059.1 thioredoxin family protein [Peribacillus psychrosaccharolyticus]MED3742321.1 thioredoxin family protein [Peribacillus psychrosaccharolyticus]QQT01296.1 thioredoxin family protein [Peribacillus psychrosaccharolyticus]
MKKINTVQEFNEQIGQDELTVGIFTTTWCPDCKRLDLFIDEVTEEHQDKQWFTIDRDEFPEISDQQTVMGIPSLLVYKNGEKIAHLHSANAKTPEQIKEFLSNI